MALIGCAECKKEISTTAKACPNCGAKVPKSKTWLWIVLAVPVLFLGFGYIKSQDPEVAARSQARSAIDLCWSEQGKKSLTTGQSRFIAGACEKMESDYVEKYGRRP